MRMNLRTRETDQTIESFTFNGARVVANDGTFVAPTFGPALTVRRPGRPTATVPTWQELTNVTISSDARFAVGQTTDPAPALLAVELATGYQTPLVVAQEGCAAPALSDDGTQLMFLSAANWAASNNEGAVQAWTIDLITGVLTQWTASPAGIAAAALAGDAQSLWAVTNDGRLLRLDRPGASGQEIVPPTPSADDVPPRLAPGSRYIISGKGLDGAQLRWQSLEIRPLSSTKTTLEFILPWAAAIAAGNLELLASTGPFQPQALPVAVVPAAPVFMKTWDFVDGLREDGSPLTTSNRAHPGETVTFFLRGLGPVDGQGRVLLPLAVQVSDAMYSPLTTLEVQDVRMDPGREGTYLLKVRLPDDPQLFRLFIRPAGDEYASDSASIPLEG
jgi:hypothetical protein